MYCDVTGAYLLYVPMEQSGHSTYRDDDDKEEEGGVEEEHQRVPVRQVPVTVSALAIVFYIRPRSGTEN